MRSPTATGAGTDQVRAALRTAPRQARVWLRTAERDALAGLRSAGQALEIAVLVPGVLVLGALYGATGAAGGVLAGSVVLAVFWTLGLLRLHRPEAAPA